MVKASERTRQPAPGRRAAGRHEAQEEVTPGRAAVARRPRTRPTALPFCVPWWRQLRGRGLVAGGRVGHHGLTGEVEAGLRVEEAASKAEMLDMKTELGEVHGGGEEHDADGGRFWTPAVFPSYAACQHPILVGEDELIVAELLDISAWSWKVGDDGIERGELRPNSGKMDSIRSILGFPASSRWRGGRGRHGDSGSGPNGVRTGRQREIKAAAGSSGSIRQAEMVRNLFARHKSHSFVRESTISEVRTVSPARSCF